MLRGGEDFVSDGNNFVVEMRFLILSQYKELRAGLDMGGFMGSDDSTNKIFPNMLKTT